MSSHESKLARLRAELAAGGPGGVGLAKSTSNLFRDREVQARPRVDLSGFNEVVEVDTARSRVSAEGMTTYADLLKGGKQGSPVKPGDPAKSLIVEMISGKEPEMPEKGDALKPEQVELISRWIKEGAKQN